MSSLFVIYGYNPKEIHQMRIAEIKEELLFNLCKILKIFSFKDNKYNRELDQEALWEKIIEKRSSKDIFIIALEPTCSDNYNFFEINLSQKEKLELLLSKYNRGFLQNINKLYFSPDIG